MKKLFLAIVVATLLVPASLFAEPSEEEITNTVTSVFGVYGMSIMAIMFGAEMPEGTFEFESNDETMDLILHYKNFPAKEFLQNMEGIMGEMNEEEQFDCPFDTISGTVKTNDNMGMDEDTDMHIDITLKGGNIKTLEMHMADEDNMYLKINGRTYSDVERFLE